MAETSSFSFGVHFEMAVTSYVGAALSIPAIGLNYSLKTKDLLTENVVSKDGRYTLEEHLNYLVSLGQLDQKCSMLVFGARNLCVNWRSPAVLGGKVYALEGEEPKRSLRPYYGIGLRDNRLICAELLGGFSEPSSWDFFCAGIPVLWDGWEGEQLLDLMLCEASDHSHLYAIPRGNHPNADSDTLQAWQVLQNVFREQLYSSELEAATNMRNKLVNFTPPLRRCSDYFHSIIGIRDDGALVYLSAHGLLEELGQVMKRRGCQRAICLENSGSIMPTFLPQGIHGQSIPLVRAPNFRPKGRAVITVSLQNDIFTSQPVESI